MVDSGFAVGIVLIIGGLILLALEIVHPGAFLLIPGAVVLTGGVLYLFAYPLLTSTIYGPLIVAAVAILAAFVTIPYYRHIGATHRPMTTTPDSLTGEVGMVITAVVPDSLSGKVRIHSEVWSARSDRPIPAGTRVRVEGGQGVAVWVRPVESSAS